MSWSRRALLTVPMAALIALPLGGCGFHPLYAQEEGQSFEPLLATIKVAPIADHRGQILTESLREGLNPRGASLEQRFILNVKLEMTRSDLGIRRDATASRSEVSMIATFVLVDEHGNRELYRGSQRAISLFNILDDGYATEIAFQDAQSRALRELSDGIVQRLAIYARQHQADAG